MSSVMPTALGAIVAAFAAHIGGEGEKVTVTSCRHREPESTIKRNGEADKRKAKRKAQKLARKKNRRNRK